MDQRPLQFDDVSPLLAALCDGTIGDDDFARLEQLLATDPMVRQWYMAYMDLHGELCWDHLKSEGREERGEGRGEREAGKGERGEGRGAKGAGRGERGAGRGLGTSVPSGMDGNEGSDSTSHTSSLIPHPSELIIQSLPAFPSSLSPTPSFVGSLLFSYLVAAVVLGVGLLIGSLAHVSPPVHVARQSVPLASPIPSLPSVVGRITGMVDCRWKQGAGDAGRGTGANRDQSRIPNPQPLVSLGDTFNLASGLLEITYNTGAKVILQGPVMYEVESAASGFLSLGKLTARVEKKAEGGGRKAEGEAGSGQWAVAGKSEIRNPKSEISSPQSLIPNPSPVPRLPSPASLFSVRTPTATVTDLGTEFGVEVNEQGHTEARVFVGEVKVAALGQRGGADAGQRILRAGQAARLEGQKLVLVAASSATNDKRFVRTMPAPRASQDANTYSALVLSLKPVVYYRMEPPKTDKDRTVVFDETGGGHHGILSFGDAFVGRPYDAGRFGRSLRLRGPSTSDHVIVPDYPKAADDHLTVSAWVMLVGRTYSPVIAANWGWFNPEGKYVSGQFGFGLFKQNGGLVAEITQRDGQRVDVGESDSDYFPQGVWQHAALVVDGTAVRLYRNGAEVASRAAASLLPTPPMASLGIGCRTDYTGADVEWKDPCFWSGRIDELAIFNRALSAARIRQLATADVQTDEVRRPGGEPRSAETRKENAEKH